MSEFDYDINKYMSYRKTSRDEAKNDKKYPFLELEMMSKTENMNKEETIHICYLRWKELYDRFQQLEKENKNLKKANEVANNIINSYESECKLSDGAKRFVHDIERGLENE